MPRLIGALEKMPEKAPEIHRYKITNTANGPVHIKEMRRALSAGKEGEFVGVLTEGTKRLELKGFISIKDLGVVNPEDMPKRGLPPNPLQRKKEQEEKEKELTKEVRESLKEIRKEEEKPKASVEEVSASEMGVEEVSGPPPIPEEKPAKKKKAKKSD